MSRRTSSILTRARLLVVVFVAASFMGIGTAQADDTTSPSVSIALANGQSDPTSTSPIVFTATFSESVAGFGDGDVSFAGSTAGGTLAAAVTGGPSVYTITVTGMTTSGDVKVTVPAAAAQDAANNDSTVSNTSTVAWQQVVDNTPPTVVTALANGQASPTSTSPIVFTATFSESVAGFGDGDVSFDRKRARVNFSHAVTGCAGFCSITVPGMPTSVDVKVTRPAPTSTLSPYTTLFRSNTSTVAWQQVVDNTPPTVVTALANGQASPTSTSPIVFTATFSESVAGFGDGDVS